MAGAQSAVVQLDGGSLSLADLVCVARDPSTLVDCAPEAMERVARTARHIAGLVERYTAAYAQVASGGAKTPASGLPNVYGVTTGFGAFKKQFVAPSDLPELQANILRSHATGVGDTTDPDDPANYFPADVVRAALVLRLNTFLKGHSGVRPELALFVRDMINAGVICLVPTRGSVGCSGDLCPLAHLFLPMLQEPDGGAFYLLDRPAAPGSVRVPWFPAECLGDHIRTRLDRKEMSQLGLGPSFERTPPRPSHKEGLALTNGAAFSAAQLALSVYDAERLANTADIAVAMTLEAIRGRTRAFDPKIHDARCLRGQRDCAANMLQLLAGSELTDASEEVQDIYSVRCAPPVHGASRDAIGFAKMIVETEINAATDNPLFFPDSADPCDVAAAKRTKRPKALTDRSAHSAGNFHGQPVGVAADLLAIAVAELANIAERRVQMLLDKNHNQGLPPCLTPAPGLNSGLMIAQYCAAGLVSENKVLAHPASVDSIPTSANAEDHVAMASIAARKVRTVLANTQHVLAIEVMTAAQALEWRMRMYCSPGDNRPIAPDAAPFTWEEVAQAFTPDHLTKVRANFDPELSRGGRAAMRLIRSVVEPLCADRVLSEDIRRIAALIESGELIRQVEAAAGPLRPVPSLRCD